MMKCPYCDLDMEMKEYSFIDLLKYLIFIIPLFYLLGIIVMFFIQC